VDAFVKNDGYSGMGSAKYSFAKTNLNWQDKKQVL